MKFLTVGVASALAIAGTALLLSGDSSGPKTAAAATATLTGSINLTCSQGGCANFAAWSCNQPVDLDSVSVDADVPTLGGHGYDAVKIGPNCTGRIGKLTISTVSEDGLKIAGGHDLSIGGEGSTIACTDHVPGAHQDGIQAMTGSNIYLASLIVTCTTATNAQLFIESASATSPTPDHIVCTGCEFRPDPTHYHSVTIGKSISSGAVDSLVCPGSVPAYVYRVSPDAVDPVNVDNVFPDPC